MSRYKDISQFRKSLDIVTNYVHYPIASILCTIFSYTRITPNQITFLALVSELAAVFLILTNFETNILWIVILLQLGFVFDLMDGMLARYKKVGYYHSTKPSMKGYYFDAISDHLLRFLVIGALVYQYALNNENGWILGIIALVVHGITQTEHSLRLMINKSRINRTEVGKRNITSQLALLLSNIYLFYLIFISFNRIDLFLITFAIAELIMLIKRIISFWVSDS
jgi:phosphatidylglycerophosphate synthase